MWIWFCWCKSPLKARGWRVTTFHISSNFVTICKSMNVFALKPTISYWGRMRSLSFSVYLKSLAMDSTLVNYYIVLQEYSRNWFKTILIWIYHRLYSTHVWIIKSVSCNCSNITYVEGMATPVLVKMELEIDSQLANRTSSPESSASSGRSTPTRINNENKIVNGQSSLSVTLDDRGVQIVPTNPLPSVQTVTNDLRSLHERVCSIFLLEY